jgi:hypothetical protein
MDAREELAMSRSGASPDPESDSALYWAGQMYWALLDVWSAHDEPTEFGFVTLGELIERGARVATQFEAYVYRRHVQIDLSR